MGHLVQLVALALPCPEALGQWQNLSELWRLCRIASRTDLTAWQRVNEMASAPPRGRPDTTQRNSSLQREAPERARGRNLRPGHSTCLSPPPMGVLRRTLTRNQVCCHLLKCSSSQGVAPHQTRKRGEGQGGDRESANSHAFPLPTSHSQPGPQVQTHPRKASRTMHFACSQPEARESCFINTNK